MSCKIFLTVYIAPFSSRNEGHLLNFSLSLIKFIKFSPFGRGDLLGGRLYMYSVRDSVYYLGVLE